LTGTFGGSVQNSASDRSYPFSYTVSAANTWELETITIPGDTTGTWLTDSGVGIRLFFSLGTGSTQSGTAGAWAAGNFRSVTGATSVVGTNGATFYITGVQLEAGTTATSFDRRDYGSELMMCQRYLPTIIATSNGAYYCMGYAQTATQANLFYPFKVTTRVPPTGVTVNSASSFGATTQASGGAGTSIGFTNASLDGCNFFLNTSGSTYSAGLPLFLYSTNSTGIIQFTGCEL
jgi:hypothetical protein